GLDVNRIAAAIDDESDVALVVHARCSAGCFAAWIAARMRWGVAGISLISAPNGASASLMALMTAAGAPIAPPSPTPFARVIDASLTVSRCRSSIGGISCAVGGR